MPNTPLFVELGQHIDRVLASAQDLYDALPKLERVWRVNGADLILAATPDDQVPLGQGQYTAGELRSLQRLLRGINQFMETPIVLASDPEGTPPGPVPMMIVYERPTGAQAAAVDQTPPPIQFIAQEADHE